MSTLDVVAEILREVAPRALNAKQIVELADGRLPTASRTPETVVSRDLAIEVRRNGTRSRFLRVDRGEFVLKEAVPTAFYNENDAYAAAWSKNLISAGEIAPGVVDERSIRDLKPADVASYRQCHFFAGIGIWSRALRDAGWPDELPIWSGSPPCQPWSSAGKRRGEADERHLWPEWFRLIRECSPPVVVGEQVASKDGYRWLDEVGRAFEGVGYSFTATEISAAAVGAPHRRQRIYFAAVRGQQALLSMHLSEARARIWNGHVARPQSSLWAGGVGAEGVGRDYLRMEGAVDVVSGAPRDGTEEPTSGSGFHALRTHLEDETDPTRTGRDVYPVISKTEGGANWMAYTRDRGREILSAPRLHDRGQPGHNAPGRSQVDGGDAVVVSDAASARPLFAEDARTDRDDANECSEAFDRWTAGRFKPERGGDADDPSALSDAIDRPHGRTEIEPDRHSEVDGAGLDAVDGSVGLGDPGLARGRRDAGAFSGEEGAGEGKRIEARDLADESLTASTDDGGAREEDGVVRGATDLAGFKPGDRIRIDGDPSWGGAVRGYWADGVEWIYCRPEPGHKDGRWRPVGPLIEPLVNGPSPGMGRTRAKRLKGYGNAIVLPLATAFVEAVIDSFAEAALSLSTTSVSESVSIVEPPPILEPASIVEAVAVVDLSSVVSAVVAVADLATVVVAWSVVEAVPIWTGPRPGETAPSGMLYGRVPPERWPYGPPSDHEPICNLFPHRGSPGGLFCDCAASAADRVEHEVSA